MSREKQRQKTRLLRLAEFIEKNPKLYDQGDDANCIVGLGNRLIRGKLQPHERANDTVWGGNEYLTKFAKRYGVTVKQARNIFVGDFSDVNRNQRDRSLWGPSYPKSAVTVLRYLARQ